MKLTKKQKELILDNLCINCGLPVHEDLRKWFKQKWVNIGTTGTPEAFLQAERRCGSDLFFFKRSDPKNGVLDLKIEVSEPKT